MNKRGFTVVELILASAFFSFVMLFAIFGFIQINRSFTRGNTVKFVQNESRKLMEQITRDLRQAVADSVQIRNAPIAQNTGGRLCLGNNIRYGWDEHRGTPDPDTFSTENFDRSAIMRVVDTETCDNKSGFNDENSSFTLPENLLIHDLEFTCTSLDDPCSSKTFNISLVVSTDQIDLLDTFGSNASCKVTIKSEFCDVVKFETAVTLRN